MVFRKLSGKGTLYDAFCSDGLLRNAEPINIRRRLRMGLARDSGAPRPWKSFYY